MKGLIKSDKLKDLVKKWAEFNDIKPDYHIRIRRGDWDHGGLCIYDGVIEFYEYLSRMSMTVFIDQKGLELKDNKNYRLEELIGNDN